MKGRFLSDDEKKLWKEVNKTTTPLKTNKKEIPLDRAKEKREQVFQSFHPSRDYRSPDFFISPPSSGKDLVTLDRKVKRKIRTASLKIDGRLDLHGLTQDRAYEQLLNFMARAVQEQYKLILVITGKGTNKEKDLFSDEPYGVLRTNVPLWLANKKVFPFVRSVSIANIQDGGDGALYVFLKT